jgi:hypothetical protein
MIFYLNDYITFKFSNILALIRKVTDFNIEKKSNLIVAVEICKHDFDFGTINKNYLIIK